MRDNSRQTSKNLLRFVALALFGLCCACHKQGGFDPTGSPPPTRPAPVEDGPAPTLQGTADGSGGNTQKSDSERIEAVLFDPQTPHLSLKRRLSTAFYRIALTLKFQNAPGLQRLDPPAVPKTHGKMPETGVYRTLKKMFWAPNSEDVFQTIENLQFKPQAAACIDKDGEEKDMAVQEGRVCLSISRLRQIPPENLGTQMVALAAHELAHERGIESETEANEVSDHILSFRQRYLMDPPDLTEAENSLSKALPLSLSPRISESCRHLDDATRAIETAASTFHAAHFLELYWPLRSLANATIKLNETHCRKMQEPQGANPDTGSRVLWRSLDIHLREIQALRSSVREFASPYFRMSESFPHTTGKQILFFNAATGLVDERERTTRDLPRVSLDQISCSVDGRPVSFDAGSCPAPTKDTHNLSASGRGPFLENLLTYDQIRCARREIHDGKGGLHVLHILGGPHSFYDIASSLTEVVPQVIGVQVLLNFESSKEQNSTYREFRENYRGFFRVEGPHLTTARNNLALLDYSSPALERLIPRAHGLYSVLHPGTTPGFEAQIHLPVTYDEKIDRVRFEQQGHRIECRFRR